MNVCFVGIGSIALRHIRNLKDLYGTDIMITGLRSGTGKPLSDDASAIIDRVIYGFEEMTSDYDAIFITNPTAMHYDTLLKVIDKSDAFFVEKPAFLTGQEDCRVFEKTGKMFYVACPLRYSNVITYIKENVEASLVYDVRCICSSYLPEWRPGSDYRSTYSANSDLGGGVSIDLIHEWDYLTYLFGFPKKVKSIISKKSDLEIDSDDIAVYIAEYQNKIVELHLDYFGRKAVRKIELYTKDDTIVCDLNEQTIHYLLADRVVDIKESRDDYQRRELLYFMRIVNGEVHSDNDLSHSCKTLRLTRGML